MAPRLVFGLLFVALLATRLCHSDILWVEESYPAAAAIQVLHGKVPYRDFWFDKPPLSPLVYVLWDARAGWLLRLAGALFVLFTCWLIYRFAREKWSQREGLLAACLLGFFLTFGIPSAVLAMAPDFLMLAPTVAAVYLAWRGCAFWSGFAAGIATLLHTKGLFVLVVCLLWLYRALPLLTLGFLTPTLAALGALAAAGALRPYYAQVWRWGWLYSSHTFLEHPILAGIQRTANWAGFHAVLVAGAAWFWWRERSADGRRFAAWALLSLGAVAAGWRFFPRYYFQLLPVMTLAAARGLTLLGRRRASFAMALLLIPLIRFGPRYVTLAQDLITGKQHQWSDLAMSEDSRAAARIVKRLAQPGDTLLVWGYRPDIFVETRLAAGSRFLDSQPLTGVIADRHLVDSRPTVPELGRRNRRELVKSRPTFIVDGLGAYNPALAIESYPDLKDWLGHYERVGRTSYSVIYRLLTDPARRPFLEKR
jgi:hypothetical protein